MAKYAAIQPRAVGLLIAGALLASASVAPARAEPLATLLAPMIAEAGRASQPRGVFFHAAYTLDLPAQVRLAGTPDGDGLLCTDDAAELRFQGADGAAQVWQHLFATPDHRGIQCLPAQTITLEGGPGRYTLAITLTDRFADTFSSDRYYLLADPVAGGIETHVTTVNRPAITDQRQTMAPTVIPPTALRLSPTAAPPTTTPLAALSASPTLSTVPSRWPTLLGMSVGLALLTLALALRRRRRPAPRLRGIIDLADRETGETRTLLLHTYPHGVGIVRHPLDLVPLDKAGSGTPTVAAITPGAAGPLLEYQSPTEGAQRTPLHSGDQLLVQRVVELRFR